VVAELGTPLRTSDVVVLDAFAVIPAGNVPETTLHLYGVQPPVALTVAEYDLLKVPLGRLVVVMPTDAKHRQASVRTRQSRGSLIPPCSRQVKNLGRSRKFPD
jgi:hypothetical protein